MNEFDDKISIVPMATNDKAVVIEFLKTFFFGYEPLVVSAEFFKDVESLERLQNNAFKTLDNGEPFTIKVHIIYICIYQCYDYLNGV